MSDDQDFIFVPLKATPVINNYPIKLKAAQMSTHKDKYNVCCT